MSIVSEIFLGNIVPNEDYNTSSTYKKYQKEACDLEKRLLDRLKDEDKQIFENFSQAELNLNSEAIEEYFCFGFRFGA